MLSLSKTFNTLSPAFCTGHVLVDPVLCTQRYFTPRPKTGLQARECGAGKINPDSDLFGALAIFGEHRADVLEFVNILLGLTIKQDD